MTSDRYELSEHEKAIIRETIVVLLNEYVYPGRKKPELVVKEAPK